MRPGAALASVQSITGPYFRCDQEEGVYWWSARLPNLDLWLESIDGTYLSGVTVQVPDIETFEPLTIPGTDFRLGRVTFDDLVDCEVGDALGGSRGLSVFETCHIGSYGVDHDYIFGAYGGVGTSYDFPIAFYDRPNADGRLRHDDIAELLVNVVTIKIAGSSPDMPYIDWHWAFSDESDALRQLK